MALIKRANDPFTFQIVQQHIPISTRNSTKIMDLSDSMSTTSSASPPSSQPKSGARRGRPRLTEDAELAKLVTPTPHPVDGAVIEVETTGAITGCTARIARTEESTFRRITSSSRGIRKRKYNIEKYHLVPRCTRVDNR